MGKNHTSFKTGPFSASVCANEQIQGRFYRLVLEFSGSAAVAFAKTNPGQFAQLDLSNTALPPKEKIPAYLADSASRQILLRRPFSFSDISTKNDNTIVEILYCVVGPATLRMTTLSEGDFISIIGPIGNGFSISTNKKTAFFVAGGMGAGPLLHLAKVLTKNYPQISVIFLIGAKSKADFAFDLEKADQYNIKVQPTTDDGSMGFNGFVTTCLEKRLDELKSQADDTIIYSCGPEAMLAKVAEIADQRKIDCQISMERAMACGIGLCQSCAVECKVDASNEIIYKLCCEDGPVFDSKEVVFKTKGKQ